MVGRPVCRRNNEERSIEDSSKDGKKKVNYYEKTQNLSGNRKL
jgi:hypothetical protein